MKTRKEQLEIELAFENGVKIEHKLLDYNDHQFEEIGKPYWNWDNYDYRIKEEPQRVPFDGSDAFNLTLQKFKHIDDKKENPSIEVSIRADNNGVTFANGEIPYSVLADVWIKWNDLQKVWEECTKVK